MLVLAASLFLTDPLPLDMPRATGYLVTEGETRRLEDRFAASDLWVSQSVDGRWMDDEGRVFVLAHLDTLPPAGAEDGALQTRRAYAGSRVPIGRRDLKAVRTALARLSPVETPEEETRPRQLPRGYRDVDYWQGTNTSAIVCAFLPEKEKVWRLATWELAEGDDFATALKAFEDGFLRERPTLPAWTVTGAEAGERACLRADARHSVSAYANWHVTDSDEFVVLDDLPTRDFTETLTNDLAILRRAFAETLPTPVDGTNALAVTRIYASRGEYLDALAAVGLTNLAWSAAYWSPLRRELVAHADERLSSAELLRTIRHEAFHQYLSNATALLPTSPWLNEGYAQYFEDAAALDWQLEGGRPTDEQLEAFALLIPSLFEMDYDQFYAGSDAERRLKYRLAWSLAVFLERGAGEVRFQPFKDFKRDYVRGLFATRDPVGATEAGFRRDAALRKKFIGAWLAYWKSR